MPDLARLLLKWYSRHGRTLPWRDHPDPYAVWVSEVMLQQTRVEAVIPYFEKWMNLFPNIQSLAKASERDVLNTWEGLGYYSRARNLHQAAQIVSEKFNSHLPRDLTDLRSLPGIGRYTVGAIASMAFDMDEPTLDGNLRRVFSRLYDVTEFADSPAGEKILWDLAARNLPAGKAGDYNQALMDLGAMICVPKNPRCLVCPLIKICKAYERGTQDARPMLKPKKKAPHYVHAAAVIIQHGKVLLSQRPSKGLLGGMWEFPNARVEADVEGELPKIILQNYGIKVKRKTKMGTVEHAYTHFKVTVHAFQCEAVSIPKSPALKWLRIGSLGDYPMGKVDRQISRLLD
jgi:A/G-specific adenine glycosylase